MVVFRLLAQHLVQPAGLLAHGPTDARRVVCVLTGHGLKDPDVALAQAGAIVPCAPELDAIERAVLER